VRILIADDHALYRDALARMLRGMEPAARVEEAASVAEVEALLEADPACELLLMDLRMPGAQGCAAIDALHQSRPGVPIVVISGSENPLDVRLSLASGAVGFLRKSMQPESMQAVLRGLLDGAWPDSPELSAALAAPAPPAGDAPRLTPRQLEVLRAVCSGAPNKQIARTLGLSEGTVKLHTAAVLQALKVNNRTEAAARARELGLE
jgi:DNA-binding NarL/FixJ family response regulator